MGAGSPKFLLGGNGGGGQAVSHFGNGVDADFEFEPEGKNSDAAGGDERGRETRAGGEEGAGVVSVMFRRSRREEALINIKLETPHVVSYLERRIPRFELQLTICVHFLMNQGMDFAPFVTGKA